MPVVVDVGAVARIEVTRDQGTPRNRFSSVSSLTESRLCIEHLYCIGLCIVVYTKTSRQREKSQCLKLVSYTSYGFIRCKNSDDMYPLGKKATNTYCQTCVHCLFILHYSIKKREDPKEENPKKFKTPTHNALYLLTATATAPTYLLRTYGCQSSLTLAPLRGPKKPPIREPSP